METMILKKSCENCLSFMTHETCRGCIGSFVNGDFTYKNYVPGSFLESKARLKQLEREGQRDIIVCAYGEAKVNFLNTPEEALLDLLETADQNCYRVEKGIWRSNLKEIHVYHKGHFILTYINDTLDEIKSIYGKVVWSNS